MENAEKPNWASQVASKDILRLSMEVKAEFAEEPEDTPEDEAVEGCGVQDIQGERDHGHDLHDETSDANGGVTIPDLLDEDEPETLVGEVHDKPPGLLRSILVTPVI